MTIETFQTTTLGAAAAAVVEGLTPKREPFAPGIYFGLDEEVYHADEALGSTDMRLLARNAREFWWKSKFNPIRDDEDEEETAQSKETKIVGRAMHAAVLEGHEALKDRYAPTFHKGNVKAGIAERAAIVSAGKEPIKFKRWRRILLASSLIRNDPECGSAFSNPIATELSVFWICGRSGMRKKMRLDAIKPKSLVDFKTIVNRDDVPFEQLCLTHIGRYGYYAQAECYRDGWAEVPALIASGAVFGAPSTEAVDRLRQAAERDLTAFTFVFLQKTGAPAVFGTTISPGNGIADNGRAIVAQAEANWKEFNERFGGTETPWMVPQPLRELDINDIPPYAFRRY
ncbi:MAG TPA: PD-(D/E)XK nuclease-like domain-containing protein [Methylosinus sp.]|jgi:hypothetical protein|uniref:PD-(D/E)XK nuclease-like domain-containing protein n=1 Tax=Methylosinus sp. TaxID=427 RepID=UPI002F93F6D6